MIDLVKENKLEGIVCKQKDSVYESGRRTGRWSKFKVYQEGEFLVGGFLLDGEKVSSIVVGFIDGGALKFAGKFELYMDRRRAKELIERLRRLMISDCPFLNIPEKRNSWTGGMTKEDVARCCWVKPEIVAVVEFVEWTRMGYLRQGRLKRLMD